MGKNYKQLNIEERAMIQTQLAMRMKPGAIAQSLNRSASTLSCELRGNGWTRPKTPRPSMADGYRAEAVHPHARLYGQAAC